MRSATSATSATVTITGVRLLLAEQLMLLAFQDAGGRPVQRARSYLRVGLPGAVLAEIALRHSVVIEESPSAVAVIRRAVPIGQAVAARVDQGGRSGM